MGRHLSDSPVSDSRCTFGLSLLIAFLVHSCRLKAVQYATRTLIYFPVLATTASVAIAWNYMFNENRGVINWLLQQVGILGPDQNVRWLISTETAMWAIVIFSAWKFIGQHFLYYFVGLQNIPDTYYEPLKSTAPTAFKCSGR